MNEQVAIQTLLQKKLIEFKSKNKTFSIRALSRKLNMQPSATNEILKGQRRVSRKIAEKIAVSLKLDPTERAEIFSVFPEKLKRNSKLAPRRNGEILLSMKLNSDQFKTVSNWLHMAILSLMTTDTFQSDTKWIAERFGVKQKDVSDALGRLKNLGLIQENEQNRWVRTTGHLSTTDDIFDLSIQSAHMNDLEIAKEKLTCVPVELRDFSSFVFPVNPDLIPKAKEIIRKTQDDLSDLMADAKPQEIYKVCTYFYPLTEFKKKEIIK